jgi:2-phosphosulfolactate phosphatase
MKLNVIFTPSSVDELHFTEKIVVVIDVLRATSTIVTAFMNGVKEVIPVGSIEFAVKASSSIFGGHTLIGGERNTKKIDGFNLGNSPAEYTAETVGGKSVILFTTNGSKAIAKTKFSEKTFICSYLNISSLAAHLKTYNKDIEIVCSGRNSMFSLEDTICAGKLAGEILKDKPDMELSDSAKSAVALSDTLGVNLLKTISETEHGKLLIENGFLSDVEYCSQVDITELIPVFSSNTIKLLTPVKL